MGNWLFSPQWGQEERIRVLSHSTSVFRYVRVIPSHTFMDYSQKWSFAFCAGEGGWVCTPWAPKSSVHKPGMGEAITVAAAISVCFQADAAALWQESVFHVSSLHQWGHTFWTHFPYFITRCFRVMLAVLIKQSGLDESRKLHNLGTRSWIQLLITFPCHLCSMTFFFFFLISYLHCQFL